MYNVNARKVLEKVSMADEDVNYYEQPPPPTESAGPSNNINIANIPTQETNKRKQNVTGSINSYLRKQW